MHKQRRIRRRKTVWITMGWNSQMDSGSNRQRFCSTTQTKTRRNMNTFPATKKKMQPSTSEELTLSWHLTRPRKTRQYAAQARSRGEKQQRLSDWLGEENAPPTFDGSYQKNRGRMIRKCSSRYGIRRRRIGNMEGDPQRLRDRHGMYTRGHLQISNVRGRGCLHH